MSGIRLNKSLRAFYAKSHTHVGSYRYIYVYGATDARNELTFDPRQKQHAISRSVDTRYDKNEAVKAQTGWVFTPQIRHQILFPCRICPPNVAIRRICHHQQ